MINLGNTFLRIAIVYALIGMVLGAVMGMSGNHTQAPTHAHVNLLGWVSMFLFGLYYRFNSAAADLGLAKWHFWVMNLGLVVMLAALALFMAGNTAAEPVLGIASLVVLLGMVLFAVVVWRTTKRDVATAT